MQSAFRRAVEGLATYNRRGPGQEVHTVLVSIKDVRVVT